MYRTKLKKFTKKEHSIIKSDYIEWLKSDDQSSNGWVHKEWNEALNRFPLYNNKKTEEFIEKEYPFAKKYAEKMFILMKLIDYDSHSSEYIDSRIGEFKLKNFDDEISQRIALEGIENSFKSDFITTRIKEYKYKSFEEELFYRQQLHECEKLNTPFIQERIKSFINKLHPETELHKRQILQECERHNNDYVKKRINEFQPLTFETKQHEDLYEQLQWREDLEQCELHNSDFIRQNIKFYRDNGAVINTPTIELSDRLTLEECEKHDSDFIRQNIKFYRSQNEIIGTPSLELTYRLTLEECEKFNSDYISREIARLKDEFLIRNPKEELKNRMNISFFEDNVKNKKKIVNKEIFWDQISVHGLENHEMLRGELDSVGKGFCLAKWNQVSILLQTGQTHSCHHPRPHVIPVAELKDNPSALHNTKFKKAQRKTMLEGGRPEECDYCWNVEDANPGAFSDRIMKSGEGWAFPYFDKIKDSDPNENIQPTYVEVSFSNQCNMACGYCDPKSSSNWQHEIATKGHYPTSGMFNNTEWMEREGIVPIPHTKPNPYRDAFWKWFPDMWPGLHTFRITGGEPLLHKDTFKVLDYIIENPTVNPRLEMSVNSNFSGPQDLTDEFIDKVKYITEKDLIWNFTLFTSIESWGKQAEYMRDGMDTEKFWNNIDKFLTVCQKPEATIMATYNITSVSSYHHVIEKVFDLKKKHYNGKRYRHYAIILDTSYLRHPEFLSVRILPIKWSEKIREDVGIMEKYAEEKYTYIYGHGHSGYYDFEREKLRRVADYIEAPMEDVGNLLKLRSDFAKYIDEFDKRRGKNFVETFPEMEDFYNSCKKLRS